jgi:hypothetical protein
VVPIIQKYIYYKSSTTSHCGEAVGMQGIPAEKDLKSKENKRSLVGKGQNF